MPAFFKMEIIVPQTLKQMFSSILIFLLLNSWKKYDRMHLTCFLCRITETDLAKVKGFLGYNMSEDIGEFVISREHINDAVNVHKYV